MKPQSCSTSLYFFMVWPLIIMEVVLFFVVSSDPLNLSNVAALIIVTVVLFGILAFASEIQDHENRAPAVIPRQLANLPNHVPPGTVYLLKAGPYYKIGKAMVFERRLREIKLQLPYPVEVVHTIVCANIHTGEKYWHDKFADQRTNGEWFFLSDEDVAVFRSHTTM